MRVELLIDSNAERQLRSINKQFTKAGKGADKLSHKFKTLKMPKFNIGSGISSAFTSMTTSITQWATALAGSFIAVNSNLEQLEIMMSTATGSLQGGAKAMSDILDFSTKVPFSVDSLADSFVKLKVSGMDPMAGTMQILTDSVAAFGGNSEQFKLVTIAIQQMVGKGVVSMEELRRQLGEQIPTAMRAMAKGLGMSMFDMVDLIKTGTLEATGALNKMFGVLKDWHAGAATKRMKSFQGAVTLLRTEWTKTMLKIGKGEGAFKSLTGVVRSAATALKSLRESAEGAEILGDISEKLKSIFDQFANDPGLMKAWFSDIASTVSMALEPFKLFYVLATKTVRFLDMFQGKVNSVQIALAGIDMDLISDEEYGRARGALVELQNLQQRLLKHQLFIVRMDEDTYRDVLQRRDELAHDIRVKYILELDEAKSAKLIGLAQQLSGIGGKPQKIAVDTNMSEFVTQLGEAGQTAIATIDKIGERYDKLADDIKETNDKIFEGQLELDQKIRALDQEAMGLSGSGSPTGVWDDKLKQIEEYRVKAEQALQKDGAGAAAHLSYLQAAVKIIDSLKTDGIEQPVTKEAVENAKKVWEYQQRITRGGKMAYGTAKKPYEDAWKAYQKLLNGQKTGSVEVLSAEEQIAEKRRLTLEFGNQVLEVDKQRAGVLAGNKTQLEQELIVAKRDLQIMIDKGEDLQKVQDGVANSWVNVGGTWTRITNEMKAGLDGLNESLQAAIASMNQLNSSQQTYTKSAGADHMAYGGPVYKGQEYVVGEYGKELFVPETNGQIVPHNELKKSNNVVDINLSIGGGERIALQGPQQSIDQLERAFADKRRYAA